MSDSVIDAYIFNEVKGLMEDAMGSFINTFVGNSPKMIQQIELALENGDVETLYLSAHQLKGGSSSIGALKLSDLAFKIEKAGRAGETDSIPPLIDQLKSEYQAVETELKNMSL